MQAQASHGLWELFVFWFFTGSGLLGLPPGERDPALLKSVPPQTLAYFEWAPARPRSTSATGVDGFVADPEIRQFFELLEQPRSTSMKALTTTECPPIFAASYRRSSNWQQPTLDACLLDLSPNRRPNRVSLPGSVCWQESTVA